MTTTQLQCLLVYLGYDTGGVDGAYGKKTEAAVRLFQEEYGGLDVDGNAGALTRAALIEAVSKGWTRPRKQEAESGSQIGTTGGFWGEIEYFTRDEFRCTCGKYCNGFPVEPQESMVRTVNEIRRRLGVPVEIITKGGSGVRCPQHNADVGGAKNSNHLYGKAADLHSTKSPQEMARVAEEVMGDTGEIGIYSWGIHVATDCNYSRFYG